MMKLEDWLDDLCVRFIINLPKSELESVERICFQVEEAQWFYEDFIRPLDPRLPSLNLRAFSLKIFQHCSLFSQWSHEHHMSAFAEFLAYKQRVPVRGAIMLNEDMDQVVLVKGWKKGANWSFPRGKINKDESDLDCAVREVYEETGFDIQAAGLVKEEKEMKFIEVTMREQHMRLYVFRGVPMDTHFEPRTRKEISKIEWYKLTDLPTLKKHKHQDSDGQLQVVNANKFYMVAPFLNPLKKWISQQRKNENRQSLPHLDPQTFTEEISQDELEHQRPHLEKVTSHGPSNLPEVAYSMQLQHDPSAEVRRLLNMNAPPPVETQVPRPIAAPQKDAAKSSALLALLRSGSVAEMRDMPHTPRDQISFPPEMSKSPQRLHPQPPFSSMPSPPRFQGPPHPVHPTMTLQPQPIQTNFSQQQQFPPFMNQNMPASSLHSPPPRPSQDVFGSNVQRYAPYQNTGDPQFSRPMVDASSVSAIPPASALPKLTNHTKSLLDAFKSSPSTNQAPNPARDLSSAKNQTMLDAFKPAFSPPMAPRFDQPPSLPPDRAQTLLNLFNAPNQTHSYAEKAGPVARNQNSSTLAPPHIAPGSNLTDAGQYPSLIDSSRTPSINAVEVNQTNSTALQPAELAADGGNTPRSQARSNKSKAKSSEKRFSAHAAPREGETAATVNGPLNQPHFESVVKPARKVTNADRRSPVPANKTLFDPKNPTPVKILTRPEDARKSPARSPRLPKAAAPSSASPHRTVAPKEAKETFKPFQPQILRRPQTPSTGNVQSKKEGMNQLVAPSDPAQAVTETVHKRPLQADSHRQALLSLFNNPLQTSTAQTAQGPVSAVSATMPASQPISPLTDAQLHGAEPISTRSRVGSLASNGGATRPAVEKRHTAAGDKAFLLGYLDNLGKQLQ